MMSIVHLCYSFLLMIFLERLAVQVPPVQPLFNYLQNKEAYYTSHHILDWLKNLVFLFHLFIAFSSEWGLSISRALLNLCSSLYLWTWWWNVTSHSQSTVPIPHSNTLNAWKCSLFSEGGSVLLTQKCHTVHANVTFLMLTSLVLGGFCTLNSYCLLMVRYHHC